jgi:hypothetical protein
MPKFTVVRRVEAFVDYVAEVEADNAEQAAEIADQDEEKLEWTLDETFMLDDKLFVTLDGDGNEIPETARERWSEELEGDLEEVD